MRRLSRTSSGFLQACGGSVVVEFALITPVMILALIGLADYGNMVYHSTRLEEGANAGVRFAMTPANAEDDDGIEAAVAAGLPDDVDATVTISRECRCPTGGAVACDTECSGEVVPGRYIEVLVTAPFTMIFDYPGIENVDTIRALAVTRIPNS